MDWLKQVPIYLERSKGPDRCMAAGRYSLPEAVRDAPQKARIRIMHQPAVVSMYLEVMYVCTVQA